MGKYDDAIGGGKIILDVVEVLNEAAADKVDKRIKQQKADAETPIEINVKSDKALKRLDELHDAVKKVKKDLDSSLSAEQSVGNIGEIVHTYKLLSKQVKLITPEIDKNNEKLQDTNKILRNTKKLIDKTRVSQAKMSDETDKRSEALEKQLKLIRLQNGNGYTTASGLYKINKESDDWSAYKKNADGIYEYVGAYKTLKEVRKNATMIAEEEALVQAAVAEKVAETNKETAQAVKTLQDAAAEHVAAVHRERNAMVEYGEAVDTTTQDVKEQIEVQQKQIKSTKDMAKAQERLNKTFGQQKKTVKDVDKPELLKNIEVLESKAEIDDARTIAQKRRATEQLLKEQYGWYKDYKEAYENGGKTKNGRVINVEYDDIAKQQVILEAYIALYEKFGGKVENLGKKLKEFSDQQGFTGAYQYALDEYNEMLKNADALEEHQAQVASSSQDVSIGINQQTDALAKQGEQIDKNTKKTLNMETAIKKYNKVLRETVREGMFIGSEYDTHKDTQNWNIRDMVSEAQSYLGLYYSNDNMFGELKYGDAGERNAWKSETAKLKRFIKAYEPYIEGLETAYDHGSKYDNTPKIGESIEQQKQLTGAVKSTVQARKEEQKIIDETHKEQQIEQNQKLISSYKDLYNAVQQYVNISKQLKSESTPEYLALQGDIDRTSFVSSKDEAIAEIKAWYTNVQRIKSSQKQGLSVYKHAYADGDESERRIGFNELEEAESTLRGYIYNAVAAFGYTVADVMNDFSAKRIRSFVESQINKYLEIDNADDLYRIEVREYNKPIEEQINSIYKSIEDTAKFLGKEFGTVLDDGSIASILSELSSRANDVTGYTLSSQTNYIGGLLGIKTPYDEIKENAKKIESYEELCAVIERYHELSNKDGNVIYGGTDYPGFNENDEIEYKSLIARLEKTSGKKLWEISNFGTFRDIDKLAETLGIPNPKLIDQTEEQVDTLRQKISELKDFAQEEISAMMKGVNLDKLFKELGTPVDQIDELKNKFIDLMKVTRDTEMLGISDINLDKVFDGFIEDCIESGRMIIENTKLLQEFRKHMSGQKVLYDSSIKTEYGDDWKGLYGQFRNNLRTKDALGADSIMQELVELFPGIFNAEDLTKPVQDQFRKIFDVWSRAMAEFKALNSSEIEVPQAYHDIIAEKIGIVWSHASTNLDKYYIGLSEAAKKEQELADAAERAAEAKERQSEAAKKSSSEISAEEIVERDISRALEQLRSAKNNETTLFSLKGVFEGDDLVEQAQNMIKNIAEQSNLSLGVFNVKDDIVKVQLYNNELKITVDQMYKLKAASEEAESAQLELVSQSFKQNVKALNENNFDANGVQQKALAAIEKIRADADRAKYDLTNLEKTAKTISSHDDFTKFNNQLKAAQDGIQAIKNATATKSSMNPLINMQRDMKVANTEIDTMQLKLDKLGDIDGVAKASEMITDMRSALEEYNAATTSEGQQSAYNNYSDLRHSFKAQMEYINAAKALNDSKESTEKKTDPIREQYQSILDLVNKINTTSENITKYQTKDGGTGIFAGYIEQLQSEKVRLVAELKGITDEINTTISTGFVQGKEYSVPFASFLDDSGAISNFLNDTRVQASLTTEEIEKLVSTLQKSQTIDVNAATKVAEQFKSVQETYDRLSNLTGLDKGNENYQALANIFGQIMQYKNKLSSDPTMWTPEESANLQTLINQFTKYGNILADVGEKEARYFSGKTRYTQGSTYGSGIQNVSKETQKLNETRKQLEDAARSFAKDSGAGDAFITNFTQTADGISSLDFSVFDSATGSLRTFRMEMGSVTEGMYMTETTVNKALSNIKAAQNQLQSIGGLLGRLDASGVSVDQNTAAPQVQKLLQLYKQLSSELSKGDNADQNVISKLTRDSKLAAAEVEKLYKKMTHMESDILSGNATDIGKININGDIYSQMSDQVRKFAETQNAAGVEIGKFNAQTNTLDYSLVNANGTVSTFRASLDALNGTVITQQTGVKQLTTQWDTMKGVLAKAGKQLITAFAGYNIFYKAISQVRQGISYVKEIDLAMTELKKVTNETEASYDKFLQTASKTAGTIGSTVSDFTEATANFARLNI